MKQLLFFLLLISLSVKAQDFSQIDEKIKSYPKLITAEKLAAKIDSDFSSDIHKVRAIYSWLATNISYDLAAYYNPTVTSYGFRYSTEEEKQQKIKALDNKIVAETLSERKAVCEGYARVFKKLCTLLNIENEFIKGYTRNSPSEINKPLANPNHAWNAVKINGIWKYFDATWGAGHEINGRWKRSFNDYFFDIPKEKIFFTHFPDETLWQLRVKRMSKNEFYAQPIYKNEFLNSKLSLISPTNGIINKNENGYLEIKIKDLKPYQRVFIWFNTSNIAEKPLINFKNNISTIKISEPVNASQLYLIVDGNVILEFLFN